MIAKLRRLREDDGFSLLEMVTAMSIFTIFVGVFIAVVAGFAGSIASAKTNIEGSGANTSIINTMDIQARYADAINFPGAGPTGIRYIEFEVPKSSTTTGVPGCFQWRYDPTTQVVAVRSWGISNTNTAINITGWTAKGEHIVDEGGLSYPFAMLPANDLNGTLRQRVQLTLSAGVTTTSQATTRTVVAFVARNSSSISVTNADANGDGQSDTKVCMQAGSRP